MKTPCPARFEAFVPPPPVPGFEAYGFAALLAEPGPSPDEDFSHATSAAQRTTKPTRWKINGDS